MVCKKCNKRIKTGTSLCPYCGASQTETVSLGAIHEQSEENRRTKKKAPLTKGRKVILAVAFAVWGLVVAGAALWLLVLTPLFPLGFDSIVRLIRFAAVLLLGLGAVLLLCGVWVFKGRRLAQTVLVILSVLCLLLGALAATWRWWLVGYIGGVIDDNTHGEQLEEDLGINYQLPSEDVTNIALFGLDDRADSDSGRSDAIIILSIDQKHNKIKLTSVARDTLVIVEDYGWNDNASDDDWTKITHAFAYGAAAKDKTGPGAAIKALNQNFSLDIQQYAYVNFHEFAAIIDKLGGVEINIEEREIYKMNQHIRSMRKYGVTGLEEIEAAGLQRLTGGQALAYSRLRKIDTDVQRGNRQKAVIDAVIKEMKQHSIAECWALIKDCLGICNTNLSGDEIMGMVMWLLEEEPETVNFSLPDDDEQVYSTGGDYGGSYGWIYKMDLAYATAVVHDFIYETNEAEGLTPQKPARP